MKACRHFCLTLFSHERWSYRHCYCVWASIKTTIPSNRFPIRGSFLALFSNPVMEFGDAFNVGRRVGMTRSIMSLGALVGPPILNSKTSGFEAVVNYVSMLRKLSSVSVFIFWERCYIFRANTYCWGEAHTFRDDSLDAAHPSGPPATTKLSLPARLTECQVSVLKAVAAVSITESVRNG